MKPSSLSTCATATLSFVAGISAAGRSIEFALRIRVSMSAIGSVIMAESPRSQVSGIRVLGGRFRPPIPGSRLLVRLPAGLAHAGDQTVGRHVAEADAAD